MHDGDPNNDGGVTPGDAQLAFSYYLNCINLSPTVEQYCAADFCGSGTISPCDGSVTPSDAQGIMRQYLGYASPCSKRTMADGSNRIITLNQAPGREPGTLTVSVNISGTGQPISAFGIELRCGTRGTVLVAGLPGDVDPEWTMFDCAMPEPGLIRIGAMSVQNTVEAHQSGTLAQLTFALPAERPDAGQIQVDVSAAVDDLSGSIIK